MRARYHELFEAPELPVPVESIAEDLLGLRVEEAELDGVSGFLLPAERRICLNARDVPARRRFTLAHEVGHWVCQCLEGRAAPVTAGRGRERRRAAARALEREANVFAAELLMPEPAVRAAFARSRPLSRSSSTSPARPWPGGCTTSGSDQRRHATESRRLRLHVGMCCRTMQQRLRTTCRGPLVGGA